jgi:hypothetical protein
VIEGLLAAAEGTRLADWVRTSRWGYAGISAAHILGIALLVGAVVPIGLRRLGAFANSPQSAVAQVLTPCAAAGLALAVVTGILLFLPRASEYAALTVVQVKLALVAVGALHAIAVHALFGWLASRATPRRRAGHAAASIMLWLAVLALGRLIAFVG